MFSHLLKNCPNGTELFHACADVSRVCKCVTCVQVCHVCAGSMPFSVQQISIPLKLRLFSQPVKIHENIAGGTDFHDNRPETKQARRRVPNQGETADAEAGEQIDGFLSKHTIKTKGCLFLQCTNTSQEPEGACGGARHLPGSAE